jgi:histidyl-tRNA synthetase
MKIKRCKGMRDLFPAEMSSFRLVEGIFRDSCLKWGYGEVKTPTIEYLHLFTSAGTLTPGRLGRVYSFLDWDGWSGERVVLRPDGTIPVARLYTDKLENSGLARLFYSTNTFIFEETGTKTRERWQCGAELIGAGSPLADVELISLSIEILKKLGLKDIQLRLSHAGLVKALLVKLGLTPEEQHKMFDLILDGDVEALSGISRNHPELDSALFPLLNMKGQSSGFLKNLKAIVARDIPEIKPHLADLLETVNLIEKLGYGYQIDIASGAGFEYYTGMIFQLFAGSEKIGGGGRYDALIPAMGGGDVPASGFGLYLDTLMNLVKPGVISSFPPQKILVRAKSADADVLKEVFKVAGSLRDAGFIAELDLDGKDNVDWTLTLGDKPSSYTLVDVSRNREHKASSIGEVLAVLKK